jgi:hypothetical protein
MHSYGINSTLLNGIPRERALLYHYTTKEAALEHILPEGRLRASPLEKTNDPRESKHWLHHLSANELLSQDDYLQINSELNERLKKHCRMLSFSTDGEELPKDHNQRNGYSYSRMWAQYGSKQAGICLVFDRDKFLARVDAEMKQVGTIWSGKVAYDLDTIEEWGTEAPRVRYAGSGTVDEHLRSNYANLLFRKRIDWRDEHEFRIIVYSASDPGEYLYASIGESLLGVIVGIDFPDVYIPSLAKLCEVRRISADQLQWVAGVPFLSHPVYDYSYEAQSRDHLH